MTTSTSHIPILWLTAKGTRFFHARLNRDLGMTEAVSVGLRVTRQTGAAICSGKALEWGSSSFGTQCRKCRRIVKALKSSGYAAWAAVPLSPSHPGLTQNTEGGEGDVSGNTPTSASPASVPASPGAAADEKRPRQSEPDSKESDSQDQAGPGGREAAVTPMPDAPVLYSSVYAQWEAWMEGCYSPPACGECAGPFGGCPACELEQSWHDLSAESRRLLFEAMAASTIQPPVTPSNPEAVSSLVVRTSAKDEEGSHGHFHGAVAQTGERLPCTQEVAGSIPAGSTHHQNEAGDGDLPRSAALDPLMVEPSSVAGSVRSDLDAPIDPEPLPTHAVSPLDDGPSSIEPDRKPALSATSLGMLTRCGMQWKFRYVDGIKAPPSVALTVGKGTHEAVRRNLTAKLENGELLTEEEVTELARDRTLIEWDANEPVLQEDETQGAAVDQAVALARVHHAELAPLIQPVALERAWRVEIEDSTHDLMGYIDIEEAGGRIRDTKTKKKTPSQAEVDRSIQLTLYALGKYVVDGEAPSELTIDALLKTKQPSTAVITTHRGPDDFAAVLQRHQAATALINAGTFIPTSPDNWWCSQKFCGYWDRCPFGAGGRIGVREDTE